MVTTRNHQNRRFPGFAPPSSFAHRGQDLPVLPVAARWSRWSPAGEPFWLSLPAPLRLCPSRRMPLRALAQFACHVVTLRGDVPTAAHPSHTIQIDLRKKKV